MPSYILEVVLLQMQIWTLTIFYYKAKLEGIHRNHSFQTMLFDSTALEFPLVDTCVIICQASLDQFVNLSSDLFGTQSLSHMHTTIILWMNLLIHMILMSLPGFQHIYNRVIIVLVYTSKSTASCVLIYSYRVQLQDCIEMYQ